MLDSLKKLFNKSAPPESFGIAIRQSIGSFCVVNSSTSSKGKPSGINSSTIKEFSGSSSEKVGEWLEELLASGLVSGRGYLVLSSQLFSQVQIDKPDLPEEEIIPALKWLVKDIVPIEPDDMIVDYTDAPVLINGMAKINVVCSHLSLLKNFVSSFKRYHVQLDGIITETVAFANLIPVSDDPILLLCQQPYEDVQILIVVAGKIHFNRYLRGFSEIGGFSQEQLNSGVCDSLSVEIQKSMDYFERQLKQKAISAIKLLLPVNHEQFIIDKLAENTFVPVSTLPLTEPFVQHRNCAASVGGYIENSLAEEDHE